MAEDWDEGPSRPWQEPVPDEVARCSRRKHTKVNCKGKKGRMHTPAHRPHHILGRVIECGVPTRETRWRAVLGPDEDWICEEEIYCSTCGKILEYFLPKDKCSVWQKEHASA